jgi:hypothetical protein
VAVEPIEIIFLAEFDLLAPLTLVAFFLFFTDLFKINIKVWQFTYSLKAFTSDLFPFLFLSLCNRQIFVQSLRLRIDSTPLPSIPGRKDHSTP